jgi:hypothetical protein
MVGGARQTAASATKAGRATTIDSPALDRRINIVDYPLQAGVSPESVRPENSPSRRPVTLHIQRKQQISTVDGILSQDTGPHMWLPCVLKG